MTLTQNTSEGFPIPFCFRSSAHVLTESSFMQTYLCTFMVTTTTTKDLVENCKEVAESSHHMGLDPQKQEQMKASLLTAGTNN